MTFSKTYPNGLRLIIEKMDGLFSVSTGVLVRTGSINETEQENGISHFIEHCIFKGTKKRSAFEISDYIDRIGASINAFTSKEITCYYTKSTTEHAGETLEVLSDIFFNSTFLEEEINKEKGVIIEEINMSEDSPEDTLFDLLATSSFGEEGLGRTILGPQSNVKRFTKKDIDAYMDKYYTADNVVISVAGNVDVEKTQELVKSFFVDKFTRKKSKPQFTKTTIETGKLHKYKPIEQCHVGISFPAFNIQDERSEALSIASIILGGGMSSRLFQTIREELGLAYSVYSYISSYNTQGVLEIYAGVNPDSRDLATKKIIEEVKKFKTNGITEQEFLRGREQIKSSFIMGRESTATQMLLFGKYMLYFNKEFSIQEKLDKFFSLTKKDVESAINESFDFSKMATSTVGPKKSALKV